MPKIQYTLQYIEKELLDIKNQLERFQMYPDYEPLKERVARLKKLLQSKRVKSA